MKIYVASSWRNQYHSEVVSFLRQLNYEVYDFKNPKIGNNGFSWKEIDGGWQSWSSKDFIKALRHPITEEGYRLDFEALKWADACVLVLPCGRSAHLESGWAIGQGKPTVIYIPETEQVEPELMYKLATRIVTSPPAIHTALHNDHSMGRYLPCDVCGDIDGCSKWKEGNCEYNSQEYR